MAKWILFSERAPKEVDADYLVIRDINNQVPEKAYWTDNWGGMFYEAGEKDLFIPHVYAWQKIRK